MRKTDGSPAVKLGEGVGLEISPDGRWVLARPPGSDKALVLVPTGTGTPIALPETDLERIGRAVFFPDGKRLLLMATAPGGKPRAYVQDLPSGKPRPITDRGYGLNRNGISPDGLWAAAWGDWTEDLFLIPTAGGEPRSVPHTKDLDFVRFSPDGKSFYGVVTGSIPAKARARRGGRRANARCSRSSPRPNAPASSVSDRSS